QPRARLPDAARRPQPVPVVLPVQTPAARGDARLAPHARHPRLRRARDHLLALADDRSARPDAPRVAALHDPATPPPADGSTAADAIPCGGGSRRAAESGRWIAGTPRARGS